MFQCHICLLPLFLELRNDLVTVRAKFSGDGRRIVFGFRQEILQVVGVFDLLVWVLVGGCGISHTLGATGDAGGPDGGRCRCSHSFGAFKSSALCLMNFF